MREQESHLFMAYVEAIGRTVGHDASTAEARTACPQEFAGWRESFVAAYGYDPTEGAPR